MRIAETAQEIATGVLAIIPDEDHWTQHVAQVGDRRCVLGAVAAVKATVAARLAFYLLFLSAAAAQYPDRYRNPASTHFPSEQFSIVDVNDHIMTRYADIRLIVEKVAAG